MSGPLTLDRVLENLAFDETENDTKLAEEYISRRKRDDGKYYCRDDNKFSSCTSLLVNSNFLRKLADKIEENAELFSQLEYLIRKIPKKEVKSIDIKLMVKYIKYCSMRSGCWDRDGNNIFIMGEDAPLASLAFVIPILMGHNTAYIASEDNTDLICDLFSNICQDLGLCVFWYPKELYEEIWETIEDTHIAILEDLSRGCTGVITEHSDMDSAIESFLESPNRIPWRFNRVLVQESIYESFRNTMTFKTNLRQAKINLDHIQTKVADLVTKCNDIFIYKNKVFLVDYAGISAKVDDPQTQIIYVEAYRTTKELLSLLKKYSPFCLSLWSNNISEANEIAFGVDTRLVWINDFANFEGPMKVSQAYYSIFFNVFFSVNIIKSKVKEVIQIRDKWLKLGIKTRRKNICNAIAKYKTECQDEDSLKLGNEIEAKVLSSETNKIVDVDNGHMCIVIDETSGLVLSQADTDHPADLLLSMVWGNGIIILDGTYETLFRILKEESLPVLLGTSECIAHNFERSVSITRCDPHFSLYRTKVIWSNFGTIFAN